jgi:hypothetical protein
MGYLAIGASGYVGVAVESESGTYQAPTKFFPIRSEGLVWQQGTNQRRVIRGTADVIGAVAGDGHVEGDIDCELLSDVLPYFLLAARGTLTKSGTSPDFTYEFVPTHGATAPNTLSITVVRAGEAFGYVGCNTASMNFGVDNGMAVVTFSMLGLREEDVAVPATPTYTDDEPYGSGKWVISVPTGTQVFDADNFSFEIEDNGNPEVRLKDELGAQFISFGERNVTASIDRDFTDKDEYEEFKDLTYKSISVRAQASANDYVELTCPVNYIETYDLSLTGVGDLVRSSVSYTGVHDTTTGGSYKIEFGTSEDVTIPS